MQIVVGEVENADVGEADKDEPSSRFVRGGDVLAGVGLVGGLVLVGLEATAVSANLG